MSTPLTPLFYAFFDRETGRYLRFFRPQTGHMTAVGSWQCVPAGPVVTTAELYDQQTWKDLKKLQREGGLYGSELETHEFELTFRRRG